MTGSSRVARLAGHMHAAIDTPTMRAAIDPMVNQFDASVYTALVEKGLEFSTARALLRDGGGVLPALATHTAIARVPTLQGSLKSN